MESDLERKSYNRNALYFPYFSVAKKKQNERMKQMIVSCYFHRVSLSVNSQVIETIFFGLATRSVTGSI